MVQTVLRDMVGVVKDIESVIEANHSSSIRSISGVANHLILSYHQVGLRPLRPEMRVPKLITAVRRSCHPSVVTPSPQLALESSVRATRLQPTSVQSNPKIVGDLHAVSDIHAQSSIHPP